MAEAEVVTEDVTDGGFGTSASTNGVVTGRAITAALVWGTVPGDDGVPFEQPTNKTPTNKTPTRPLATAATGCLTMCLTYTYG